MYPNITTPLYRHETGPGDNEIYIKREDLLPYSFGGNKVRIAACYLAHMESQGCNHLLAYGNARSNLCRVLSNLCAAHGYKLTILSPADDDGQQRPSMNAALCRRLGANIIPCQKTGVAQAVDDAMDAIRAAGGKPYYIYGDRTGQGNRSTPVTAYAEQYAVLMEQCLQEYQMIPDAVFLATGTGMTQAGLLCGQTQYAHKDGRIPEIIGLSVARDEAAVTAHLTAYIRDYADAHAGAVDPELAVSRIRVYDRCRGQYGAPSEDIAGLIRHQFTQHGLPLDMTYTGKAYYAMQQFLAQNGWQGCRVVFIHTGGTPLFFDQLMG
ncbi:MAG: pyridoxal-phosphate dependent enzyme [Clostridiales bacterium]|nr:pyridoxal-phosphate dependent enzyme [Clostridiales bacterium]